MSAEESLLLPFDQFAFSELKNEGKKQRLRLVFATHEVTLHGHSLRRIVTAIQRFELSYISPLDVSHRLLIADGQPIVLEITVTEVQAQESQK
jgi:hypothetical protein